jgi:mono/diheme cytochrome c family protein
MNRTAMTLLAVLAAAGCKGYRAPTFEKPMTLGGQIVPAEVLTEGARSYELYCRACHGDQGDGKGPSAPGLRPPPRDFTLGAFKFAAVPAGTLPHDDDFVRIVRSGLHGTAMLAWDGVPDKNLAEIIQYLKTFSARWQTETPGDKVEPTPDPWQGKEAQGIAFGKKVYHGLAQCITCHPSYAPRQFIFDTSKELTGNGTTEFRDDMYGSVLKESDYGVKILPPDFTRSELRSIRAGHELEDFYRVIAAGVGGTAMPTWKGSLPEEDIWGLVHFVNWLHGLKGTAEPQRMLEQNQAADERWTPPAQ